MQSAILTSSPLKWAVGGWSIFIAENVILSENRTWIIEKYGDDAYHYMYGTCSTAASASVGYGYLYKIRNQGPFSWALRSPIPAGAKALSFAVLSVGLGIASQTFPKFQIPLHYKNDEHFVRTEIDTKTQTKSELETGWKVRCPFDFTDSKSTTDNEGTGKEVVELQGLDRISRHPGLWSFGLIGLGAGLLSPSLPTRIWMSMPVMVALIGGSHTDSRHRRGMGGSLTKDFDDVTSNVPFLAMLSGKQGSVIDAITECGGEIKPLNAMIGVGLAGIIVANRGRGSRSITTHIPDAKALLQRS